jgi:hypothetical protein
MRIAIGQDRGPDSGQKKGPPEAAPQVPGLFLAGRREYLFYLPKGACL